MQFVASEGFLVGIPEPIKPECHPGGDGYIMGSSKPCYKMGVYADPYKWSDMGPQKTWPKING